MSRRSPRTPGAYIASQPPGFTLPRAKAEAVKRWGHLGKTFATKPDTFLSGVCRVGWRLGGDEHIEGWGLSFTEAFAAADRVEGRRTADEKLRRDLAAAERAAYQARYDRHREPYSPSKIFRRKQKGRIEKARGEVCRLRAELERLP